MTQHTPGPWRVEGYRIVGPIDSRSKHRNGRMLVGGVVDDMNDWRAAPAETRDEHSAFAAETTANARLIAAAPDMLALLRRVAEHFTNTDAPLGRDARSIIAAAQGEEER